MKIGRNQRHMTMHIRTVELKRVLIVQNQISSRARRMYRSIILENKNWEASAPPIFYGFFTSPFLFAYTAACVLSEIPSLLSILET